MKICYKCKEKKKLSFFHKKSFNKDGYSGLCIDCEKKRWHKWYVNNSDKVKNNVKSWLDNSAEYRLKHRAHCRRWRDKNKERMKQLQREWGKDNLERIVAKHRQWLKNNPHKAAEYNHKRRARKLTNGGDLSAKQIMELKLSNTECFVCESGEYLEIDHIIPLSAGGRNDIDNVQILCRSCNRSKASDTMAKFLSAKEKVAA